MKAVRNFSLGILGALAIGGCAADFQQKPPLSQDLVTEIRNGIVNTCGFQVQIDSLISLLSTFVPQANLAQMVVDMVCKVAEPLGKGMAGPRTIASLKVNGVKLRGHFVG